MGNIFKQEDFYQVLAFNTVDGFVGAYEKLNKNEQFSK